MQNKRTDNAIFNKRSEPRWHGRKTFLIVFFKKMQTETKEKKEEKKEKEEKMDTEGLKKYIQAEALDALDSALDKKANELTEKFLNGVAEQRKKAIETSKTPKKTSDEEIVRKWFKALVMKDGSAMAQIQKDYLQTGEDTQGGYLVPAPLLAEVQRFTEENGIARRDMRYLPFSGPGNERRIPALASSVSVFWPDEAGVKSSTKPTFALVTQTLKKIAAIVPLTEEIVEDSAINLISLLGELIGEAVLEEEDRVFLAGDTGDGDPYDGVINAANVVPVETTGAVADLTADDLNNAIYAVPTSVQKTGKFYLSPTAFQIIQQLKDNNGNYIVQTPIGNQPPTLWNRPYELTNVLPDSSASGDGTPFGFFTDLRKTCVYGDKAGLKVKILEEGIVKSAEESPSDLNLATQDMIAMRVVKRVGYVPVLPSGIAVLQTTES
jgi:HK97 family phage major capsid protein